VSNPADQTARKIAVVEDDEDIRDLVTGHLRGEGFDVAPCENAEALGRALAAGGVELIVLDLMMPGEDGYSICRRVSGGLPIIIVSARSDDVDRIVGLEIGADDYLPKPFNPRELTARIRAVLRRREVGRNENSGDRQIFSFKGWTVDLDDQTILNPQGESVVLSAGEFNLLVAFIQRP
jgi:two-component system OmpR family response regulator